ncbi:MAG: hypothetical protein JWR33_1203 [Naasia sp.]|uniref:hypothetical protein n=1 Tax=Naasia sp. TaxID=2546198 RepID=UPI0026245479|nr:hypothetical protein [Naasia sp.]MCU1570462.1 hypothetical protein [Naasia sp.]
MIPASRLAVGAGATALAVALALGAQSALASAASAEDSTGMLISLDGSRWAQTPAGSLFPAGFALVPGGSMAADVWVKNDSSVPAYLLVSVADASGTTLQFTRDLSLQATTQATPTTEPVSLDAAGVCNPLLSGEVVQPGAIATVHLAMAMSAEADNTAMGGIADARLQVSLVDARAGSDGTVDCDDLGGSDPVPGTDAGTDTDPGTHTDNGTVTDTSGAQDDAAFAPATLPLAADPSDPAPAAASGASPAGDLPTLAIPGAGQVHPGVAIAFLLTASGILMLLFLFVVRKRRADASE